MAARRTPASPSGQEVVATAARLVDAPDLAATLQAIAAESRNVLGADRATCYVHDVVTHAVTAVYSTEDDPQRQAFLQRTVGLAATKLPILALQFAQDDPLLVIEDLARDSRVPPELVGRLGAGALLGVRLEHLSVQDDGAPALLGTLFCSYERPRRFSAADRQATRGMANLATLGLANARLQAETAQRLDENRALTAEQAALRRVATKVAAEASPEDVFDQAAQEVAGLLGVEGALVARFAAEDAVVVGTYGGHSELGERLPTTGDGALARVLGTGRSALIEDYSALEATSSLRAHAIAHGYRASVATPVEVDGRLWGAVLATTKSEAGMPSCAVGRLERFAELMALAIANTEARARLAAQANTDSLTGLLNHRSFFQSLHAETERAHRHGRPLSLVVIDLDHFKAVNDQHGHQVGDLVLIEVARRLDALTRTADILARVGGEEFAWVLPDTDSSAAWAAAERARRTIAAEPISGAGKVTLSAGVAELRGGGTVNELFRAADAALYWAKTQGRDQCMPYTPEHDEALDANRAGVVGRLSTSVKRLVELAREQVGLPLAMVSEFQDQMMVVRYLDGDGEAFGMRVGGEARLKDTYCQRAADGRMPQIIRDARRDECTRDLPVTRSAGIGAYVGTPITLPGAGLYGMLSCLSARAEPGLADRDVRLLRHLAAMIGEELEREKREEDDKRGRRRVVRRILGGEGLRVVLQPIVELAEGRVVAAEALSRFDAEPRRAPDAWFGEAATLGLTVELELTAIALALSHLTALPPGVRLSLNASPATICAPRLPDLLAPWPGSRLALEVTEHARVDDYEALAVALVKLRSRGVQLMVDDMGAGFSSFRHVLGLRPDVIKLDLSLTRDIDRDPVRRALAASLVAFNREIGSAIVAEGIETRAELQTLRELGVTHGQGYYLAEPGPGPIPVKVALPSTSALTKAGSASPSIGFSV